MKVLNVNEVLSELDASIKKKKEEKKQILDLRDSLNKISDSKEFIDGKMGNAIREHFTVLHIPAVLLINQFLEQYTKQLNKIKDSILNYEDKNGFINQEFIEHDVEQGIKKIERMTDELIEDINQDFNGVRDLVSASPLVTSSIHYSIETTRLHNKTTIEDLNELDQQSVKELKKSLEDLQNISSFIKKIKTWSSKGMVINENTITEINNYFAKNDTLNELIDSAVELSVEQGDSTVIGDVADWLDKMGKFKGGTEILKATGASAVLLSKALTLEKSGNGKFKIRAHPDWKQNSQGKYNSKLAEIIHGILKKGSNSSVSFIQNYFSKFNNAPSRVLRSLIGIKPHLNTVSYKDLLGSKVAKYSEAALADYKVMSYDIKATLGQFKDVNQVKALVKKVPGVGTAFSFLTNAGELVSDKNKHKSNYEKAGRAAAGIGLDAGTAALIGAGAALGSFIPGPGTVIGGAVGAAVGIAASFALEDKVKDVGERAGKWVDDTFQDTEEMASKAREAVKDKVDDLKEAANKTGDALKDKFSDAGDFVSGLFN